MRYLSRSAAMLAALLAILAATLPAGALELMPYSRARITAAQWQHYYDRVKAAFGDTEQRFTDRELVTYNDDATRMLFTFTLPNNAAHPAWIARQVVRENGDIRIVQVGYFAGDEAPFARLYREYEALTAKVTDQTTQKLRRNK